MKFFKIASSLFAICFFLTGCDQDIWSTPSAFGLPLGVVMLVFWAVSMINQNADKNAGSNTTAQEGVKYKSTNLVTCKTCRKEVSRNANACPHCGEPNFKPDYNKQVTRSQNPSIVKAPIDSSIYKTKDPEYYKQRNLRKKKNQNAGEEMGKKMGLYYYHDVESGEVKGPFSIKEIGLLEASNEVDELTQVCKENSSDWVYWKDMK